MAESNDNKYFHNIFIQKDERTENKYKMISKKPYFSNLFPYTESFKKNNPEMIKDVSINAIYYNKEFCHFKITDLTTTSTRTDDNTDLILKIFSKSSDGIINNEKLTEQIEKIKNKEFIINSDINFKCNMENFYPFLKLVSQGIIIGIQDELLGINQTEKKTIT